MVSVYHKLFVDRAAALFTACLRKWTIFHNHAIGTFALLHLVICYKMQLVIAKNPLRMHTATGLHQCHN